jgi:geranylgeranyl diphosphate synthase, type II
MSKIDLFQDLIHTKISGLDFNKSPAELYEPMKYALTMGGKRIRPLLTLLACDMFGEKVEKSLPAALSIEVFHNFTLVHDDIMDVAPLRRGKETVFKKWDQNVGILSGDAMLAKAFEILVDSEEDHVKQLVGLLSKVAIEVCEGQQLDMNFEHKENVTIAEYLEMIRLKTAVLTASALLAGAIVADAATNDQNEIYNFGENLGIAFQIKDDILDVFGDEIKFGKLKGGDIVAHKKTFLYLTAFEQANASTQATLKKYFEDSHIDGNIRVNEVTEIYNQLKVKDIAESKMNLYYQNALENLKKINVPWKNKEDLFEIAEKLMVREF